METKQKNQLWRIPLVVSVVFIVICLIENLIAGHILMVREIVLFEKKPDILSSMPTVLNLPLALPKILDIIFAPIFSFFVIITIQYFQINENKLKKYFGHKPIIAYVTGVLASGVCLIDTGLVIWTIILIISFSLIYGFIFGYETGQKTGFWLGLGLAIGTGITFGFKFGFLIGLMTGIITISVSGILAVALALLATFIRCLFLKSTWEWVAGK